jgi:pimeloyl-ACP methyl ester carboxylesterase
MAETKYSLIEERAEPTLSIHSESPPGSDFEPSSEAPRRKSLLFPIISVTIAVILIIGGILAPLIIVVTKANACSNKPPFPFPLQEPQWSPCSVITDPSVYTNGSTTTKPQKRSGEVQMPFTDEFLTRHGYDHEEYDKRNILAKTLRAQCATVAVPLDWNPDALSYCSTINIFVKRIYFSDVENADPAPKQVWWIPGGGGVPSSTLEDVISAILPATRALIDFFIFDKRGVGQSAFIECPDGSAASSDVDTFVQKCLPYARSIRDRLKVNTFTNTAKDMSYIMQSVASAHKLKSQVFVIGSSQGSYLAQRLLHVVPTGLIDGGVILDSVLAVDITKVSRTDEALNLAMLSFFSRCTGDSFCSGKFVELSKGQQNMSQIGSAAPDLITTATNIKLLFRASSPLDCLSQTGMTYPDFAKKLALIFSPSQWQVIAPLFYRLARCSDSDVAALKHFSSAVQPPQQATVPGWSILVELNHDFSELWNSTRVPILNCAQLRTMADSSFAATYVMSDIFCPNKGLSRGVIGYEPDQYFEIYPPAVPPLLIMTSDLDQALLLGPARHAAESYRRISKSQVRFVEFPNSGHTPSTASPMGPGRTHCGMEVMFSYILSDTRTADTSCLAKINKIDFSGSSAESAELSRRLFNTPDLWE